MVEDQEFTAADHFEYFVICRARVAQRQRFFELGNTEKGMQC